MRKQPMYSVFLLLTILCTLGAISTVVPDASVSKACLLGYKAHCTFTPISTVLCLLLAGMFCRIRVKKFKSE